MATWKYQKIEGYVSENPIDGFQPIYRSWNGKDHFYTASKHEYDGLPSKYKREGIRFYTKKQGGTNFVYLRRLYRGSKDNHFYTSSINETLYYSKTLGYTYEGTIGRISTKSSPELVPLYRAYHSGIDDHFYTTNLGELERVANILTSSQVKNIINNKLKDHFKHGKKTYVADSHYYTPTLSGAREICREADVDIYRYTSEKFDCDDFAHLLKAAFIQDAYDSNIRRYPHAFGIIWASKPDHAMNIVITTKKLAGSGVENCELYIVEPLNNKFSKPSSNVINDIYLVVI